jgi:hypothetical protein
MDGVSEARIGAPQAPPTESPGLHPAVPSTGRGRRIVPVLAGPALIAAAVLVVHHRFAFGGLVTNQHIDILSMWLPTHCYLGESLSAGHVPAWNPHVLAGHPFAADPQSGWMYLPAMLLYTVLPCASAIRWFIVIQPLLAGLGAYGFLRGEEVPRPAATVGGLALALAVAGSYVSLSLPFSGALAWTAVMLAGAAWFLQAATWPRRLVLGVLTAVAWGQVASAHLTHGLAVATGVLAVYLVVRAATDVRGGRRTLRAAVFSAVALVGLLPLVNLAVLVPRLAYLPRTSITLGYRELHEREFELSALDPSAFVVGPSAAADWPLWLSASPGAYLGIATLALSLVALANRRRAALAWGLAAFGGICYLLSLTQVAQALEPVVTNLPLGDVYFHEPDRLRYGLLLALALLAGLGAEAWWGTGSWRVRAALLVPGALLWGVGAEVAGVERPEAWIPVLGLVLGALALGAGLLRPALAWALPAVLAVELVANGLAGQTSEYRIRGIDDPGRFAAFPPLRPVDEDPEAYLDPGSLAEALLAATVGAPSRAGRYVVPVPEDVSRRGWLPRQEARWWHVLANQRAMLFGLQEAGGYNPTQLRRYWDLIRASDPKPIRYNHAFFRSPSPNLLDLLGAGFVIARVDEPPETGAGILAEEGGHGLYRLSGSPPLVSVVPSWTTVGSAGDSLEAVTDPGFDPQATAILEEDPGLAADPGAGEPGPAEGDVLVREPQRVRFRSAAGGPAVAVVRIPFDTTWHATVDGRAAPVLVADHALIGVPLEPGDHVVELTHDDPSIGYGVLGSAVFLTMALGGAGLLAGRERRRRRGVT